MDTKEIWFSNNLNLNLFVKSKIPKLYIVSIEEFNKIELFIEQYNTNHFISLDSNKQDALEAEIHRDELGTYYSFKYNYNIKTLWITFKHSN